MNIIRRVVHALYGLPPVVVGVFVYSLLSKQGFLGSLELLFSIEAMVFAQFLLVFPLIWGGSWSAFEMTSKTYDDTLYSIGLHGKDRFFAEFGLARKGVSHAVVLGFGRAIAEVGAVIIVGGNIAGKTRVMTTSIVLETSKGNMEMAIQLGLILLMCTFTVLFIASLSMKNVLKRRVVIPQDDGELSLLPFEDERSYDLSIEKGGRVILSDVNIRLRKGAIIAIVGPSGSGKTTILRALAGRENIEVTYGPGSVIWMPQHPVSVCSTVAEECVLPRRLYPHIPQATHSLFETFRMDVAHEQLTSELSGGEIQRLVLLRQLSLQPSLLLLDECTASLDGEVVQSIETEIRGMRDRGCCVVIATHNINQAQRLADELLVLHQGKILPHDDRVAQSILSGAFFG